MKQNLKNWRNYWNAIPNKKSSDFEVDRGIRIHCQEVERAYEKKLISLIAPKKTDCIFDAGCGTGINLERLSGRVKWITGMDFSEGMISRADKRIAKNKLPNVQLMVGNLTQIGLKSDIFDKTICISVMQYLNEKEFENALNELVRISKDEGILILHFKNLSSLYLSTLYILKKIKNLFKKKVKIENYRSFKWYDKKLSALGADIYDHYSTNILVVDFMPKTLLYWLKSKEIKHCKNKSLQKYGADLHIKVKINKQMFQ